MTKPEKIADPSMDDILASIRRIIAEEPTGNGSGPTASPAPGARAPSRPPAPAAVVAAPQVPPPRANGRLAEVSRGAPPDAAGEEGDPLHDLIDNGVQARRMPALPAAGPGPRLPVADDAPSAQLQKVSTEPVLRPVAPASGTPAAGSGQGMATSSSADPLDRLKNALEAAQQFAGEGASRSTRNAADAPRVTAATAGPLAILPVSPLVGSVAPRAADLAAQLTSLTPPIEALASDDATEGGDAAEPAVERQIGSEALAVENPVAATLASVLDKTTTSRLDRGTTGAGVQRSGSGDGIVAAKPAPASEPALGPTAKRAEAPSKGNGLPFMTAVAPPRATSRDTSTSKGTSKDTDKNTDKNTGHVTGEARSTPDPLEAELSRMTSALGASLAAGGLAAPSIASPSSTALPSPRPAPVTPAEPTDAVPPPPTPMAPPVAVVPATVSSLPWVAPPLATALPAVSVPVARLPPPVATPPVATLAPPPVATPAPPPASIDAAPDVEQPAAQPAANAITIAPVMEVRLQEVLPPALPIESVVAVRTLEDTVAELLRPMLRQWLDANMPRIVEKALKIELAQSVKPRSGGQA